MLEKGECRNPREGRRGGDTVVAGLSDITTLTFVFQSIA